MDQEIADDSPVVQRVELHHALAPLFENLGNRPPGPFGNLSVGPLRGPDSFAVESTERRIGGNPGHMGDQIRHRPQRCGRNSGGQLSRTERRNPLTDPDVTVAIQLGQVHTLTLTPHPAGQVSGSFLPYRTGVRLDPGAVHEARNGREVPMLGIDNKVVAKADLS